MFFSFLRRMLRLKMPHYNRSFAPANACTLSLFPSMDAHGRHITTFVSMHIIALLKPHITSWAYFCFLSFRRLFLFILTVLFTLFDSFSPSRSSFQTWTRSFFSFRAVIAAFRAQFFFENLKDRISCQMQRKKDDLLWEFSQVRLQSETEWTEDNEKRKKKKSNTHTKRNTVGINAKATNARSSDELKINTKNLLRIKLCMIKRNGAFDEGDRSNKRKKCTRRNNAETEKKRKKQTQTTQKKAMKIKGK